MVFKYMFLSVINQYSMNIDGHIHGFLYIYIFHSLQISLPLKQPMNVSLT